jgi:hypothetical protein
MSSAITAVVAGAVVSSALADDNGAEAANNSVADANALQAQISRDQWNRYKEIYEPLERQMVDEAQDYASPENYAKAAGEASATVSQQFSKARDRLTRTPGLDPSSGAYQSSLVGLDLAQAANDATQQNLARKNVTDTAYARKQSALGLGKGLDSTAASGMSSVASSNLSLANAMQRQSNAEAQAGGQLATGLVKSTSNWLNNTNTTSKPAATQVDTNSYFDSGTMFA